MESVRGIAVLAAQRAAGQPHERRGNADGVGLALQGVEDLGDLEARTPTLADAVSCALPDALQALVGEPRSIGVRETAARPGSSVARLSLICFCSNCV